VRCSFRVNSAVSFHSPDSRAKVPWVADFWAAGFAASLTSRPTTGVAETRVFQGEQFAKNLSIADRLREVAEEKECTPAQLALAWLLRRHQDVIPIPGTSSIARVEENIRTADLGLSEQDLNRIETALPKGSVAGERYAPAMMKIVNG
jgi:aryl-alcohol dehydrogenase-like predicted oxidoreductase